MKRIGFLSFGHWSDAPYSQTRSGSDALIQAIELAEAAEAVGADGACGQRRVSWITSHRGVVADRDLQRVVVAS